MEKQTIFKVGDKVFDAQYGWGIVTDIDSAKLSMLNLPIRVEFDNEVCFYTLDGKDLFTKPKSVLSFKEYTFEGFSQERPQEVPKRGQIVWVRYNEKEPWLIRHFVEMDDRLYKCSQTVELIGGHPYIYLTTQNPYENAES